MTFDYVISCLGVYRITTLQIVFFLKFMFSKKATKIDEIFTVDLTSTLKISSIFVAVLENKNFKMVSLFNFLMLSSLQFTIFKVLVLNAKSEMAIFSQLSFKQTLTVPFLNLIRREVCSFQSYINRPTMFDL